jgi:preprotein translocase subunit SecA
MRHEVIGEVVTRFIPPNAMPEEWNLSGLHEETLRIFGLDLPYKAWAAEEGIADEEIRERVTTAADRKMAEKAANIGPELMRRVEKSLLLQTIDHGWRDHLAQLDYLRAGVNLRAYGQRQPLLEYQREAFDLFQTMLGGLRERVTAILSRVEVKQAPPPAPPPVEAPPPPRPTARDGANPASWGKVARNEPCPCGSGKKFKHCHGALAPAGT